MDNGMRTMQRALVIGNHRGLNPLHLAAAMMFSLPLSGCITMIAATLHPVKLVTGNENGATIKIPALSTTAEKEGLTLAEQHCAKFNKAARELGRTSTGTVDTITYACIPRGS